MLLSKQKGTALFLSIISITAFVISFGFALYGNEVNIVGSSVGEVLLVLLYLPIMSIVFMLYAFPFSLPAVLFIILMTWLVAKVCAYESTRFQKIGIGLAALLIYISIILGNTVAVLFERLGP